MHRMIALAALLGFIAAATATSFGQSSRPATSRPALRILVFSKTAEYRHDSIADGIRAIQSLGLQHRFEVDASGDASLFTKENLAKYDVIVFLNTTGDILNDDQQAAMESFIKSGKGFVGVHAAADTEYGWEWYGNLVGASFASHPAVQSATIVVRDADHPSTRHLPSKWQRTDEWYNFDNQPRKRLGDKVRVLATLDEKTYTGGTMGDEHPFAWCHEFDGGRAWYTAGGHTAESFAEPLFLQHLLGGIMWAAGVKEAEAQAPAQTRPATSLPSRSSTHAPSAGSPK